MTTEGMSDAEIDLAVRAFLFASIGLLAPAAQRHYSEQGRGVVMADLGLLSAEPWWRWVTGADLAALVAAGAYPPDDGAAIAELVGSYDPSREFVLVTNQRDGRTTWEIVCWEQAPAQPDDPG